MRLIGMLDSPYVRRVAISLHLQEVSFAHEPLSVFRDFEAFARINPVVKAPTLVTDCGIVLMESTLILDWLDGIALAERQLSPNGVEALAHAQIVGLALAACEKAVQIVYERNLRPAEKQHEPWVARVAMQMAAAWRLLEERMPGGEAWLFGDRPMQADVTAAVVWTFTRAMLPEMVAEEDYPRLTQAARRAEAIEAFRAYPHS